MAAADDERMDRADTPRSDASLRSSPLSTLVSTRIRRNSGGREAGGDVGSSSPDTAVRRACTASITSRFIAPIFGRMNSDRLYFGCSATFLACDRSGEVATAGAEWVDQATY